ncbi:hypothetical protein E2562_004789 [Oryza meyeriana var. granulata]|uniref:Cyclin-like domain-containing protein n=1 Tax=Oryza meyeriana var. granulata TaxID=110450 RepID=A0A6G1DF43_9ORYZ|nr:hypothetical protein E2562_004789 [Oryza meyeriana var. granulata]
MEAATAEEEARKARNPDCAEGTADVAVAPDAAEGSKEADAGEAWKEPDDAEGSEEPDAGEGSEEPVDDAAQLAVVPHVEDIDEYLRALEAEESRRPITNCGQEIQGGMMNMDMRGRLVNWLVAASSAIKLLDDTVHLAVSYVDRFLSKNAISQDKLQLLSVTALFVASKYEEVDPPKAIIFSAMTKYTYSRQQVVEMEADILKSLNFEMGTPTAITFVRKFANLTFVRNKYKDNEARTASSISFERVSTITSPKKIKASYLRDIKYGNG